MKMKQEIHVDAAAGATGRAWPHPPPDDLSADPIYLLYYSSDQDDLSGPPDRPDPLH